MWLAHKEALYQVSSVFTFVIALDAASYYITVTNGYSGH